MCSNFALFESPKVRLMLYQGLSVPPKEGVDLIKQIAVKVIYYMAKVTKGRWGGKNCGRKKSRLEIYQDLYDKRVSSQLI